MEKEMTFDMISIAVVLRDYIDVKEDVGYKNFEHEMLVDVADSLFNVGIPVGAMQEKYQAVYNGQTQEFWALVLKDINAINSQVSSHNVHDLLDDYKDLLKGEE